MRKINAIQANKIMSLNRELYGVEHVGDCLSYNVSMNYINDKKIQNKLFDLLCREEEFFYFIAEDLIKEFEKKMQFGSCYYTAGFVGRMGKHLCLFEKYKDNRSCSTSYLQFANDKDSTTVKKAFTKLVRDIRKSYMEWALMEMEEEKNEQLAIEKFEKENNLKILHDTEEKKYSVNDYEGYLLFDVEKINSSDYEIVLKYSKDNAKCIESESFEDIETALKKGLEKYKQLDTVKN